MEIRDVETQAAFARVQGEGSPGSIEGRRDGIGIGEPVRNPPHDDPPMETGVARRGIGVFERGGRKSQSLTMNRSRICTPRSKSWLSPTMLRLGLTRPHRGHGPCFDVQKAQALGREVRRGMIEPDHPVLSIGKTVHAAVDVTLLVLLHAERRDRDQPCIRHCRSNQWRDMAHCAGSMSNSSRRPSSESNR